MDIWAKLGRIPVLILFRMSVYAAKMFYDFFEWYLFRLVNLHGLWTFFLVVYKFTAFVPYDCSGDFVLRRVHMACACCRVASSSVMWPVMRAASA